MLAYFKHGQKNSAWGLSTTLAHELGHNLHLYHTYSGSGTTEECRESHNDYMEDLLNEWIHPDCGDPIVPCDFCYHEGGFSCDPEDPNTLCTNNIMGGGNHLKYHITPLQMGKMHRALSLYTTQKYVKDDSYSPVPWVIDENQDWDFRMRFYNDLEISNNSSLVIKCSLLLVPQAKITVESGSQLLILDGDLVLKEGNEIIVENGGRILVTGTLKLENNSSIVLEDESSLEILWGSLVLADNSSIIAEENATILFSSDSYVELSGSSEIEILSDAYFCLEDGAQVALVDSNSAINLYPGYINGVNTNILPPSNDCVTFPGRYTVYGNGKINDFNDLYIQNETITTNQNYAARNIYVGHFVTNSMSPGDVVITNNSHVTFSPENFILFDTGFKITLGSSMELIPNN